MCERDDDNERLNRKCANEIITTPVSIGIICELLAVLAHPLG